MIDTHGLVRMLTSPSFSFITLTESLHILLHVHVNSVGKSPSTNMAAQHLPRPAHHSKYSIGKRELGFSHWRIGIRRYLALTVSSNGSEPGLGSHALGIHCFTVISSEQRGSLSLRVSAGGDGAGGCYGSC